MSDIEIWEPRWKDKVVLVAVNKARDHNYIIFTRAPSLPGRYYISGRDLRECPRDSNGRIACFAVPLSKLKRIDQDSVDQDPLF
jgi:hypothetical protein